MINEPRFVSANLDFSLEPRLQALVDAGIIRKSYIVNLGQEQVGGDELLANDGNLLVPGDEGNVFGPYPLMALDADGNEVPVVTTPGEYRYVGRLEVDFDEDGNVLSVNDISGPVRVAGGDNPDAVEADFFVESRVVNPVSEYVRTLADNVIGNTEVELDGLRPSVRTMETNQGNLIADALFWTADQLAGQFSLPAPDVALQNGGGIRNNTIIPVGDITELTTFNMCPFSNFVTMIPAIPADQFKEILENAVSRVEFVDGRFAQISGFSFTWDPNGTSQELDADGNVVVPGTRVVDVTLDDSTVIIAGGVVDPMAPALNVATINFLATGGDQYPFRGADYFQLGVTYQQAVSDYIQQALAGVITEAEYPFGGQGRIVNLGDIPMRPQDEKIAQQSVEAPAFQVRPQADGGAHFQYQMPQVGDVRLTLHDLTGRRVAVLVDGAQGTGLQSASWNGRSDNGDRVSSGIYFGRLETANSVQTEKFVVVR